MTPLPDLTDPRQCALAWVSDGDTAALAQGLVYVGDQIGELREVLAGAVQDRHDADRLRLQRWAVAALAVVALACAVGMIATDLGFPFLLALAATVLVLGGVTELGR